MRSSPIYRIKILETTEDVCPLSGNLTDEAIAKVILTLRNITDHIDLAYSQISRANSKLVCDVDIAFAPSDCSLRLNGEFLFRH